MDVYVMLIKNNSVSLKWFCSLILYINSVMKFDRDFEVCLIGYIVFIFDSSWWIFIENCGRSDRYVVNNVFGE